MLGCDGSTATLQILPGAEPGQRARLDEPSPAAERGGAERAPPDEERKQKQQRRRSAAGGDAASAVAAGQELAGWYVLTAGRLSGVEWGIWRREASRRNAGRRVNNNSAFRV